MRRHWYNASTILKPHRIRNYSDGGGAAPSWSPTDEASLQLFLDFHDPAGDGIIPSNGDRVPQIVDKSPNGIVFAQATTSKQGQYVDSALDGYGAVDFDIFAFQKYASSAGSFLSSTTPFTVVMVQRCDYETVMFSHVFAGNSDMHGMGFLNIPDVSAIAYARTALANDQFSYHTGDYPDPFTGINFYFRMNYNGSGLATLSNHSVQYNGTAITPLSTPGSGDRGTTHYISGYSPVDEALGHDGPKYLTLFFSDSNSTLDANIDAWVAARYPSL
jgi:hypothetical protein